MAKARTVLVRLLSMAGTGYVSCFCVSTVSVSMLFGRRAWCNHFSHTVVNTHTHTHVTHNDDVKSVLLTFVGC